jgi:AraC family transcriptional regulator of adaptative response/methylated-DNA-[protein]-cysteine methyltransferase
MINKPERIIDSIYIETPLGKMLICAVEEGICLLEFADRKTLPTQLKTLSKLLDAKIVQGDNRHFNELERQLAEYFEGKRKQFTVPLCMPGSEFQTKVWNALLDIPYGNTRSYKEHASALKMPEAVRAVANANGLNRIAILIPCHRVIGSGGQLTGYAGGIKRKGWLLELEHINKPGELQFPK